jgi:RNA polymerase sigma-70 factor (ECF subfamily)
MYGAANVPLALDAGLIDGARAGGPGLESLLAAVWPEAYRIALSILRDPGLAEDAAQEACVTIARSLSTLKTEGAFRGWSYRIIVNHAITTARRRPRTQPLEVALERGRYVDPSDALDLHDALATLPVSQRAAVVLYYYAGLTSAEIADAIGQPSSTIRFYLMLARRALRKALTATNVREDRSSEEALSNVH